LQLYICVLHCKSLRALLRGKALVPNFKGRGSDMGLRALDKGERGSYKPVSEMAYTRKNKNS
jgi:hypothetical protein